MIETNKEKRNEIRRRFLINGETQIEESDYDFLFNFDTYKNAIINNLDKSIIFLDNGKMYNTSWCLYYKDNNCYYRISDTIEHYTVEDKIIELYPYSDEELYELFENKNKKKNIKKKSYLPTDNAPGKHKDKTWLEVSRQDPGYIKWMITATKDKELKNMLETL
jgi:hypothetical protein